MKKKADTSTGKVNQSAFLKGTLLLIVSYLFAHSSFRQRPESRTSETRHWFSARRRLRDTHDNIFTKPLMNSFQRGSVLIGIIVTMVIMAVLGTGMLYLTTTSTFNELIYGSHSDAYYVAEAGGRYATSVIRDAYANDKNKLDDIKNDKTFKMANGNSFQIKDLLVDTGNPATITFSSIGMVGSGLMQAKRQINYSINPANQTGGGSVKEITADTVQAYKSEFSNENGPLKVVSAFDDGGAGNWKQYLATAYFNTSDYINFASERIAQGGFLSYDAQVKVKSEADYFAAGLGFRLHDIDLRPRGFYVSFMRFGCEADDTDCNDGIPTGETGKYEFKFPGMERGAPYIILWMDDRITVPVSPPYSRLGWKTLLAYKKLDSASGVLNTVFFSDDMESGENGWQADNIDDPWVLTTQSSNSVNHSWYIDMSGRNITSTLTSKQIDASGMSSGTLSFWYRMRNFQRSTATVQICTDVAANNCSEKLQINNTSGWQKVTINNITGLTNTTSIKFVAKTNNTTGTKRIRWYVDDVTLEGPNWSTLLVNLVEKNLTPGDDATRSNVIKVYYSLPTNNPVGTKNWPSESDTRGMTLVEWDWIRCVGQTCPGYEAGGISTNGDRTVVQTKYYRTTNTVPTQNPTWDYLVVNNQEVGISVFGTESAIENHVFFTDFALRIGSGGGGSDGSGRVIQY